MFAPTSNATAPARGTRSSPAGRSARTRSACSPARRATTRSTTRARSGSASSPRSTGRAGRSRCTARTSAGATTTARSARRRSPRSAGFVTRDAAPLVSGGAVRRPQRRTDERRAPHAHRPGRGRRCPGSMFRDAWRSGRQRRARATLRRTRTRSRPRASTATAASTSCSSAPRSSAASATCSTRSRGRRARRRHVAVRPSRGRRGAALLSPPTRQGCSSSPMRCAAMRRPTRPMIARYAAWTSSVQCRSPITSDRSSTTPW